MRHIVSVSLGSSKRDHAFETDFMGEQFRIERIGTDGDWNQAIQLIRDLDGKIDAFGMGGIDLYIFLAGKRYVIRDAQKLVAEAKKTPMVDGSGLKNTLERKCILDIQRDGLYDLRGKNVLMEFADIAAGLWGFLVLFGCYMVIYGTAFGLRKLLREKS